VSANSKKKLTLWVTTVIVSMLSSEIGAQGQSKWILQQHSLVLPFFNATNGKYVTLLIAYEKNSLECKPSVALLALEGNRLGTLVEKRRSSKTKDKLIVTINGNTYYGEGDTAINTYSNGLEIVSFFNEGVIGELKFPSKFSVDIGKVSSSPIFYGETLNSINFGLESIIQSCIKS